MCHVLGYPWRPRALDFARLMHQVGQRFVGFAADFLHMILRLIPTSFQLRGYESVCRVYGLVASP